MKQLFLLRHGKSDWESGFTSDHERPLAHRGQRAAERVGRFLTALGKAPDSIVSSSAVRAHSTARLAKEAGGWDAEIEVTPDFYQAVPAILLDRVRRTDEKFERLLLVGHEPTWSETVGLLVGGAEVKMVTASLARVDFPLDRWVDVRFGSGLLGWLVTPKILVAAELG
jgi:phosphohistidine phosphatase